MEKNHIWVVEREPKEEPNRVYLEEVSYGRSGARNLRHKVLYEHPGDRVTIKKYVEAD